MKTPRPSPRLAISLLGCPEIRLDGLAIHDKFQSKVLALLAYLAFGLRPYSREHLIEVFWPDVDAETARSNLRVALYRLRQTVGEDGYLRTTREALALDPDACRVDTVEFFSPLDAEASPAQLETLLALYRGPFLDGTLVENCPGFAEWLELKREDCHRQALALLDRLITLHERNGELGKALHHAERYLELEPWNEAGHRKIMTLLARDGRRDAALAQYETCRITLARELGTAPDRLTDELADRIKAGGLAPATARPNLFSFPERNASSALGEPRNVLIVDDHLLFRAGLSLMLTELGPDVTVFEAASCEEALALPEPEEGFDIILLDLKFPGMNGLDGLQLFRARFPTTPVVLFSSDEETAVIEAGRERGAMGYLSKGMSADTIVTAIEQVLSGNPAFPLSQF